ncbi:helix-turn-helix domain-containing protein [Natrialbaceae archaeon A-arb3/5]
MITASLRIRLPENAWVAELSESFPDATFRLLAGTQTGETAVELGEIVDDDPRAVTDAVAAHSSIVEYNRLELTDDRSIAKYETTDTMLYGFVEESSFPLEFPVVVENGWYELDFTGTRGAFDRLRTILDATEYPYELQSLVEAGDATALLTDRQREVLDTALREGYFDVPRNCTLAELAAELGIDKSTASGILRRGERRILVQALTGATGKRFRDPNQRG